MNNDKIYMANLIFEMKDFIVPVIGEDAFIFKSDSGQECTLLEYVVNYFAERGLCNIDEVQELARMGYYGLSLLEKRYNDLPTFDNLINNLINEMSDQISIKKYILDFIDEFKFPLLITTNPFNILENTLAVHYKSMYFRPGNHFKEENIISSENTIYHIFGQARSNDRWVYNEYELLYFMRHINKCSVNDSALMQYITEHGCQLMFLGSILPDWTFRLLMFPLQEDSINKSNLCNRRNNKRVFGYWLNTHKESDAFENFLCDMDYQSEAEVEAILNMAVEQIRQKNRSIENIETEDQDFDVFVSYASEDEDIAKKICAVINITNHTAWFAPVYLRGGDSYWEVIENAVKRSRYFVSVITGNFIRKMLDYNVNEKGLHTEINEIAVRDFLRNEKTLAKKSIPIIIENEVYTNPSGHSSLPITASMIETISAPGYIGRGLPEILYHEHQMITVNRDNLMNSIELIKKAL